MLKHLGKGGEPLERVVVIGAAGFVGGAVARRLSRYGVEVLEVGRSKVDLLAVGAANDLASLLQPGDAVVAAAAIAPVKDLDMLKLNLTLFGNIADALVQRGDDIAYVLNISSDAIYADTSTPLTEASPMAPGSYHGVMHLAREMHFQTVLKVPMASLRPTLIYGASDPHNGYGPNRFRRLAEAGKDIVLFGEGEELRDHVWIDDVAELARLMLVHRSIGALNAATGRVASFREIAELVVAGVGNSVQISGSPRNGPMPHNGYRPFDISACEAAFPSFRFTPLEEGLLRAGEDVSGGG